MQLDILTPENRIFSGKAEAVQLPGKDGLFQILDNHAPIIATLAEGTLKVDLQESYKKLEKLSEQMVPDKSNDRVLVLEIKGGVVEVQNNKVIVLAD